MALTNQVLFYLNDMLIEIEGLQDVTDPGNYLNAATVTVTLVDSVGAEVGNETWPLTMAYVSNSDGIYRATLNDDLTLILEARYTAKVSANGGAGLQGYWELPLTVKTRKFT